MPVEIIDGIDYAIQKKEYIQKLCDNLKKTYI